MNNTENRRDRLLKKTIEKVLAEEKELLSWLKSRSDYQAELDYFLDITAARGTAEIEARVGRPVLNLLCNQVPLELIAAAGYQPVKVASGSLAEASFAAYSWPALMCPVIKGVLTKLEIDKAALKAPWVIPTTCDWVVKFWEARKMVDPSPGEVKFLELPHFRQETESQSKWLSEVIKLKEWLETVSRQKIARKDLLEAESALARVFVAVTQLKKARQEGRLSLIWFLLVIGSLFYDLPDQWAQKVTELINKLPQTATTGPKVFLAGSPIFYPNYKLPILIEEAHLRVVADDLCSSERIFPPVGPLEDTSIHGLLASMAGRYHQGSLCPTFGDNERRVNNILGQRNEAGLVGVIFVVLKGCHPYDLESSTIEMTLKNQGLRFLRLETDYALEDRQNLLTRLEAFRHSLSGD
ncbi:MAG: 2-hydroxyacyl-CoA dehydratase family protein [Deltaproteobacteria bacterium]|jgi:benzoyl-CoA reductase/2-hydroxyglutaryl-CoA dehydratase subunit BcrC/BadD/HgdB|nr:2-hydroxyacyl-CoA dehydratase family protein [Deltaproteobacteria bacterium]